MTQQMSIQIQCPSCGKRYRVDDRFAGKRVKCRNCSASIVVAADQPADDIEEIDEAMEAAVGGPPVQDEVVADARPAPDREDGEDLPQGFGAAIHAARMRPSKRRFSISAYPGAAAAHQHLPWVIGLVCIGLSIHFAMQRVAAAPQPQWHTGLIIGLSMLLFLVAAVPLANRGLKRTAEMLRFDLPQGTGWRMLGLYSLPVLLAMMLSDSVPGVICGILVGILMLMPLIWATFQLHWVEAVVAWMMSGLYFAASAAAIGGAMFFVGLGIALSSVEAPAPAAPKPVAKAPPPKPLEVTPQTLPTSTQPLDVPPGPTVVTSTQPVAPPVPPDPIATFLPDVPPPAPPKVEVVPKPPPVAPRSPHVRLEPSPIVSQAKELTWVGEYQQVLDPDSLLAPPAVLKRHPTAGEVIEILPPAGEKPASTVSFRLDPGGDSRYVVSPGGDLLARVVTWPKPGVQVWTTADNKPGRTVDFDDPTVAARVLCFRSADEVLVQRTAGDLCGIQVYNVRTGVRNPRLLRVPMIIENGFALSPNGLTLAIAAKVDGTPQVQLIELSSGRTRKLAIPLAPQWPLTPAGLAFSPDSSRIGIVFEQDGNVLAVAWNVASTLKTQEHVYPAGMLSIPPRTQFKGRAMDWLDDASTWVLFGSVLVDVPSGQSLGSLGVAGVLNQRVVEGRRIYIEAPAEDGTKRLVQVELNAEAIAKTRPAPPK
jgi:predicted Zn finger-like uncharacterized protein